MVRMAAPLLGVLVFMGIFGMVWLRSEIISTEYAIGRLENRMEEAIKEKQQLEAVLSSAMSIREVDQRGLGLNFPDRQRVFYVLREDGGLGQMASLKEGRAGRLAER
jgi:hypothetical protein